MFKIDKADFKPIEQADFPEICERKGFGHPDSFCDAAADACSRALCKYYFEHFGRYYHHNVDKAALVGGAAKPDFGGGLILEPQYFLIVGRAINQIFKDDKLEYIPVSTICLDTIREVAGNIYRNLDLQKHIQFDYLDFEYKDDLYLEHDRSKYLDLYKSIEKLENVTEDAKKRILSRISESISLRDICRSRNDSIIINLVNETICLCQRNLHINIPLSKENILDFIEKKYPYKIFNYDNNNCNSCGRLYEGKTRRLFGI